MRVHFRIESAVLEENFMENSDALKDLDSLTSLVQRGLWRVSNMHISGYASPEGKFNFNVSLAKARRQTLEKLVRSKIDVADSVITYDERCMRWDYLYDRVQASDLPKKQQVLDVLTNYSHDDYECIQQLRKIDRGRVWRKMIKLYFRRMRWAGVIVVSLESTGTLPQITPVTAPAEQQTTSDIAKPESSDGDSSESGDSSSSSSGGRSLISTGDITLKTNLIGLGMGHFNAAAEIDLAEHWAVSVPFYYSGGVDYFKSTIKFRGIVLQPEVRYYLTGNDGFYVGGHLGLGWYNFALNGDYRIQDHKGNRPAWGGGLGLGYTMQFKKNPRWGMEFCLGTGVYDAKYDMFYNEENGPYYKRGVRKTFVGIDNASVAFTYKFDVSKAKGGRK